MGLMDMGFDKPTPIQHQAIPVLLEGKDILASAQTGTGKTAAFVVPILEKLSQQPRAGIRALVLAPTRELAIQIDQQFWSIGYHSGITSACIYGGSDWGVQEKAIREGVDVLVATPGRLIDHIKVSSVDFSNLEFLVLDEADRMLDMGFLPDVRSIIHRLPKQRQTLLFSATLSGNIDTLAKEITIDPVRINVSSFKPAEGVTQKAYKVSETGKLDLVLHLIDESVQSAIVFVSTKRGVDSLARALGKKGVKIGSIHGDRDQKEREATLSDFTNGRINVIVATDVMARGIDVTGISHVINFNVPRDVDDYIHRIGRTARAEKKGTAITLVSREDSRYFSTILKEMKDRIEIIDLPDNMDDFDGRDGERSDDSGRSRASGRGARQGDRRRSGNQPRRRPATADDAREIDKATNTRTADESGAKPPSEKKTIAPAAIADEVSATASVVGAADGAETTARSPRRRPPRRRPRERGAEGEASGRREHGASGEPREGRTRGNAESPQGERGDRARSRQRGGRGSGRKSSDEGRSGGSRNAPPDQKQIQRIKNITEPFGKSTSADNKNKESGKGIWSKIKSIFGS
jgi:ATP-dependent RNA helicase RhlE